jgi:hypothetical protein
MEQKRTLKVEEAVDEYMQFKLEETKQDLLRFLDEMTTSYGEQFQSATPRLSGIEFVLARLAIDCHNLWLLFSDGDANNIFRLIFSKYLSFEELSQKETADKLFAYMDILDECQRTDSEDLKTSLRDKFAATFLKIFLGRNMEHFYQKEFPETHIINPLLLAHCSKILFEYKISWRAIRNTVTIE